MAMQEVSPPAMSPKPWSVHRTGSHIGIKDAESKFVIRKVVSALSIEEYQQLSTNFEQAVLYVNKGLEDCERAVVDAAVAWHLDAGDWAEQADTLGDAIETLLELRSKP